MSMTRFTVLAIPFHQKSQNLGGFFEIWTPGAVQRTLDERKDLRALKNHDGAFVLGRVSAGTMTVHADARGLHAVVDADSSITYVDDLARAVARKDIDGASFAFRTISAEWEPVEDVPVRRVTDAEISEVSIVTFPAFLGTSVSVGAVSHSSAPRGDRAMPSDPVDARLEYASPQPHERRDVAIAELELALRWWREHPGQKYEVRYGAPPRRHLRVSSMPPSKTRMPPAASCSLKMLKAYQRQIESEL